jgi:hypothetical protein
MTSMSFAPSPRSPRVRRRSRGVSALLAFVGLALVMACSSSSAPAAGPSGPGADAGSNADDSSAADPDATAASDANADAFVATGMCADAFGSELTAGFGRIDGTIYAVQKPTDTACTLPNRDHVVLQVLMHSAVYRLVINVQSDRAGADPKIRIATLDHALPSPPFAEGWHLPATLDYVTALGAHSDASFTALTLDEATTTIVSALKVGDPVAVYGTSGAGRPESAHLIHRNAASQDGAIVINPTTSPAFMLFHFDNQTF